MRGSTVLSLSLQLVFPALIKKLKPNEEQISTRQAGLIRRSTVLSLSLQLVFPALIKNLKPNEEKISN
jgi:hypothetical protein